MRDWFPSKELIDETALRLKEAHKSGYKAEEQALKLKITQFMLDDLKPFVDSINETYVDSLDKGTDYGSVSNDILQRFYDYIIELLFTKDAIDIWLNRKEEKEKMTTEKYGDDSFVRYFLGKYRDDMNRNGRKARIKSSKGSDSYVFFSDGELERYVSDTIVDEDGEEKSRIDNMPDDRILIERITIVDSLADLKNILDELKVTLDRTRQTNSKICNRTFSSEFFMLKYIPYSDGRLLKEVSTQFEAVTYYSLFGFLMESDIIDPAEVNSIDDIYKCRVPEKYRTKDGYVKMIPHADTCEYLKKFHEIEKTPSQLSDNFKSFQKSMNKPDTTAE